MSEIKGDSLVNRVVFKVDNNSFNDCLNKLRKAKSELKSFSKSCGKLGKGFGDFNVIGKQAEKVSEKIARAQARIQAARIKQTTSQMTAQNKELQSMRRFYREQEKLSAKAAKQAAGIQASRRVQAVAGLTAKNPELEKMRAYYQQEERISARVGNAAVTTAAGRKNRILANNERMVGMFDGKTVAQFQRRMQSLNAKFQKGQISLGQYNARMAILRKEMAATAATAQRMQSSLSFNGFASGVQSLNAKVNSLLKGIAGLGMAGGYAMQRMISGSMDAASIQNKTYFGLLAQNNDDKAMTGRQMDFINRMSSTYGMDKAKVSTDYMKFAGSTRATMGEDQRQQLFEALNIKGTSYGITGEQFSLAAKALEQMSSKGRVAAEELRSQIGDHLPGAVQDFYEAWKKSEGKATATMADFEKAMKNGDVKLEKISGALAEIWGQAKNTQAFSQAMNTPERAMQRMKNSLFDLQVAFMGQVDATDGVTTLSEHLIEIFNRLSVIFDASGEGATNFGSKVGEVLNKLSVDVWYFSVKIGDAVTAIKTKMDEWGITVQDAIKWGIGFIAVIKGLNIVISVTSALWKFYGVLKALGLLGQRFGNGGGVGGGGPLGVNGLATALGAGAISTGSNVERSVIDNKMQEMQQGDPKHDALYEFGRFVSNAGALFTPGGDTGPLFEQIKGWFSGNINPVTAPVGDWKNASLSTKLPTAPATASRAGNKVEINQKQVIKFDDNKLEGLIRIVSSEVTAESMGEMIDVINGGIESTRE